MSTAEHSDQRPDVAALQGWACYAAALGWPVFRLRPGTKHPLGHRAADCSATGTCADGHRTPEQYASTDAELIRGAWSGEAYGIGIATGPAGLVVIDLDVPKHGEVGPAGETALATLADERGAVLPDTYTVITPSGGRHLYYTAPAGVMLRSTAGRLAPRVDTRAWGGYVAGPGTVLPNGGYELLDDRDPAELPAWIVQALCEARDPAAGATVRALPGRAVGDAAGYGAAGLARELDRVRTAEAGRHNEVLSNAAYNVGQLVGGGFLDADTARAELTAAAAHLITGTCSCTARECERVITAGMAAGADRPRRRTA